MKKFILLILLFSGCLTQQTQEYQTIKMNVSSMSFQPDHFTVKKGIPVKWEIDGTKASGCTKSIRVPQFNINADIGGKKQTLEFTPTGSGNVEFSCWMGMVRGIITVQD